MRGCRNPSSPLWAPRGLRPYTAEVDLTTSSQIDTKSAVVRLRLKAWSRLLGSATCPLVLSVPGLIAVLLLAMGERGRAEHRLVWAVGVRSTRDRLPLPPTPVQGRVSDPSVLDIAG